MSQGRSSRRTGSFSPDARSRATLYLFKATEERLGIDSAEPTSSDVVGPWDGETNYNVRYGPFAFVDNRQVGGESASLFTVLGALSELFG